MEQRPDKAHKRLANDRFAIHFIEREAESCDEEMVGEIVVGEFSEGFMSSLSYWTKKQYLAQWKMSLENIINSSKKEALVTSMYDPGNANFINIWAMYREADVVFLQEHILFLREIEFDEKHPAGSVLPREAVDEDGNRISEWKTTVLALKDFIKSCG